MKTVCKSGYKGYCKYRKAKRCPNGCLENKQVKKGIRNDNQR
jgi:hypothetical protein